MLVFFAGNTNVLVAEGVADPTGELQTTGSIAATIKDADGDTMESLTLSPVAGEAGTYQAISGSDLAVGSSYTVDFVATIGGYDLAGTARLTVRERHFSA